MENMDKGLTVRKWVLINRPKIPQMPQNLSAQIVCPTPKVWDFDKKKASLGVRCPCSVASQFFLRNISNLKPFRNGFPEYPLHKYKYLVILCTKIHSMQKPGLLQQFSSTTKKAGRHKTVAIRLRLLDYYP